MLEGCVKSALSTKFPLKDGICFEGDTRSKQRIQFYRSHFICTLSFRTWQSSGIYPASTLENSARATLCPHLQTNIWNVSGS